MAFEQIVFYAFSAVLVFSAGVVITVRNPVHAALFLVLCFFSTAGLWLLLRAEFLAIALVLVYVGAVMVLFLFVVMMLDINIAVVRQGFARYLAVGGVVEILLIAVMAMVVGGDYFGLERTPVPEPIGEVSNTRLLGLQLYTDYVYPFEIASVILLVAIIAAIALTLRRRPDSRYQEPGRQVEVRRGDRVRLVSMKSEERR